MLISALFFMIFSNIAIAKETGKSIVLRYGEHKNYDRFVFDFDKRPEYIVKEDNGYTSIYFNENIDIKSNSIINYRAVSLIHNQILKDNRIRFSIPANLIRNFELKNRIVIDVAKNVAPENSFIIEEIKEIPRATEKEKSEEKEVSINEKDKDIELITQEYIGHTKKDDILTKTIAEENGSPIPDPISQESLKKEIVDIKIVNKIDKKPVGKAVSLGFPWTERTGLAVFQRDEFLWIVFDKRKNFNTSEMAKTTEGFVYEIMQIPHATASILRLKLQEGITVNIREDGLLWVVDLLTQEIETQKNTFSFLTQYISRNQSYLFAPTTKAGDIVLAYDPDIGDVLMFAPVFETNLSNPTLLEYSEFNILPSTQGLVLESFTDDILLSRNNSGITIKAIDRGLNISPNLELLKKQALLLQETDWIDNLIKDLPMHLMHENYANTVSKFRYAIASSNKETKNQKRMELAKYYVAKGLGAEALGVLKNVLASKEIEAEKENTYGLMGISYFLLGRYEEAIEALSYGRMSEFKEAVFWRTVCEAAIEPSEDTNLLISTYLPIIKEYPDFLKISISKIAIENAINVSDDTTAQNFLDIIQNTKAYINYNPEIDYWSFEIMSMQGYSKEAQVNLNAAAKSTSNKYSAISRKKIAVLEYKIGKKTDLDTIHELERLKYVWGEESFQISLLEELYNIFIASGNYYNAMENMEKVLPYYKNGRRDNIEKQMIHIFEDIYINDLVGNLSPIKTLALFNDFEWVLNKSHRKNEIIIRLSDKLVSVDLLERAYKILSEHIEGNETSDNDKARISSRLAIIDIFNRKYSDAIKNIDKFENIDMPEHLKAQRRIIKTKALLGLKKYDEAIDIIEDDNSKKAIILKTEIYANMERWSDVADHLKLLIDLPKDPANMTDRQASIVIEWLTSLRKAKRNTVIVFARKQYKPYFANSSFLPAFDLLTTNLDKNEVDLKKINSVISQIDSFSSFIKQYNSSVDSNSFLETKAE